MIDTAPRINRAARRSHKVDMSLLPTDLIMDQQRSNWVRLRTLVALRWFAIAGQIAALLVALFVFQLRLETGLIVATIGASMVANIVISTIYPSNKRLFEREATFMLIFDILQLSVLLSLTGGLNNPFALLILAPVTIAATVLHLSSTILLGALAMTAITVISLVNVPLTTALGFALELPRLFHFGFWIALLIGVVFLATYARQVTTEMHNMSEALLATQLALAREQKLTDLGGVVAAAAHELGTPLATIMLVSSELTQDLADQPDHYDDAKLINQQAKRCRDILGSMGQAGKDDLHLRQIPFEALVHEAAEPHLDRGKTVRLESGTEDAALTRHPIVSRRPEVIHGLRNLIQNAVDFATSEVEITASWSATELRVQIMDDGAGFPQSVIGRIGDPFVGRRRQAEDRARRPGYQGMGLGLFIAKTLLERTGAKLLFRNAPSSHGSTGAVIDVVWARSDLETESVGGLGENQNNPAT